MAELGLRMHPLLPKNKVPIVKAWQTKATTDESIIRQWSAIHRDCNWGVATGAESGVFVVDLDPKSGGDKSWARLVKANKMPDTVTVLTGGGGVHLYFAYPKNMDIRNSASKIGKGVDIRGDGGQVAVPPSLHPSGRYYEWEDGKSPGEIEFAKPPKWLLSMIVDGQRGEDSVVIGEQVEKGTRNNQIYHQALYLARQGALQEVTLEAMLAWCRNIREEVDEDEVEATVDSAYKYHANEKGKQVSVVDLELSDVGNAQRLIRASGDNLRYVPSLGWHVWDNRHWGRDVEDLGVRKAAVDTIDQLKADITEQIKVETDRGKAAALFKMLQWSVNSHSAGKLTAMVEVAKVFPKIVRSASGMDDERSTFLLNCVNGTLDLRTGELVEHDREMFITRLLPFEYHPKAKCPTWLRTLNLAFGGDKDMIAYFKRAIGYSLSAALSEQCFFICWGESGNNGKSTLLETVQRILGDDYAMMSDARVVSSKDKDNHVLSSLAALNGVRMVSINEISDTAVLDEELIKQLTGGDTLQAKKLYMEPFTYKPKFKIWMRANNKPIVRGTSEAFWRRVKLIPFTHTIPPEKRRPRHEVDAELVAESEGILAWAVQGFQEWYSGGLRDPQQVIDASGEYREASDVVAQFMSECTVSEKGSQVTRKALYNTFKAWYEDQGLRYIMSSTKFSRRVADRLDQHGRVYANREPAWTGIKLTENAVVGYMAM